MGNKNKDGLSNGIIAIIVVAIGAQLIFGVITGVYGVSRVMRRVRENMIMNNYYEHEYEDSYDDGYDDDYSYDDIANYNFKTIQESAIAEADMLGKMEVSGIVDPCYLVKKEAFSKYKEYSNVAYEESDQVSATNMRIYSNPELMMEMYKGSDSYSIRIVSKDKTTTADLWFYFLRHSIPEVDVRMNWDDDAFLLEEDAMDYISAGKNEGLNGYKDSKIEFKALQVDTEGAEWSMLGWIK